MTMTTFKAEQNAPLSAAEIALEKAYENTTNSLDLAAMVAAFLTETDDNGRNTMWSEQGMVLKGIADVAYRKLHTKKKWINRNNQQVSLGVIAQYKEAVARTDAADELDDGTEIAGRAVDEAQAAELERKRAKQSLENMVAAFGTMYETITGREYVPWMPQENVTEEPANKKATKQDREARKARLAELRK